MGEAYQSREWRAVRTAPPLQAGIVQVWWVDACAFARLDIARRALSEDERSHAQRLRAGETAEHFIAGRAALRILLSAHGAGKANLLRIEPSAGGKPSSPEAKAVRFNVSHSGGIALVALALQEVGVDVESISRHIDLRAVAARMFTADECSWLFSQSNEAQQQGFFQLWTMKEAVLKADSRGLRLDMASFRVPMPLPPRADVRLSGSQGRFSVSALPVPPGFAAAVATAGPHVETHLLRFPPGDSVAVEAG